ncbi:pro-sigmaK processing inhibitor BofA family protein [Faecalimonas sp.]
MEKEHTTFFIDFIIRVIVGIGLIFFINQYLSYKQIEIAVGINPLSALVSGVLGVPGVALLYGILVCQIL